MIQYNWRVMPVATEELDSGQSMVGMEFVNLPRRAWEKSVMNAL